MGTYAQKWAFKEAGDKIWVIIAAHRIYRHHYDEKLDSLQKKHVLDTKRILKYDKEIFLNLPDERLDVGIQDIIIALEKHVNAIKPEIVYVPFRGDNNQDHRAVFDALRVVLRPPASEFVKKIFMYEVPSSTDHSPPLLENAFMPNYYVDISGFIGKKIKAYKCYRTERRHYPHPRSEEALRVLAKKRGVEIGFKYAEAFMVLREKWE